MSWLVDIVFVGIIVSLIIRYAISGFTKAVLNFAKLIASAILAIIFGKALAPWILETFLTERVSASVASALSGIIAYALVYIVAFLVLTLIISLLCKIKIPLLTTIDKFLGAILGLVLSVLSLSIVSTVLFTSLQFFAELRGNPEILDVYNNSYVFKFIYELRIFEFIRNLI